MPGLLRGVARVAVISGTATAVSNRVSRRQAGRWASQDDAGYQEAPPEQAPPPPAADAGPDMLTQLRELGELKEQGVLTEEEFATQKAKILAAQ
ncbi:hypothetical protein DSM104299_03939 [Baekduia alba]|uniref:SHOCT domain-containing protein n=1 Tax=Baekduia alba TaxID=2997333 RepID=UPI0023415AAA|nr:SHOCT domain-containing protein [Baekduia alba]WCB95196.1 hypothetical protein DSM104299_03939 [Baekduia alba]